MKITGVALNTIRTPREYGLISEHQVVRIHT